MNRRRRAVAYLALAAYFAACSLSASAHDAPRVVQAAAVWGMGASLALACAWWVDS